MSDRGRLAAFDRCEGRSLAACGGTLSDRVKSAYAL